MCLVKSGSIILVSHLYDTMVSIRHRFFRTSGYTAHDRHYNYIEIVKLY
jgi:hypothetical protein